MVNKRVKSLQNEIVVFDLETTGLDSTNDDITQYALIKFVDGKPIEKNSSYIYTDKVISPKITSLTGITNEDTDNGIPIEQAIQNIIKFVGDSVIVGHNLKFDMDFLKQKSLQCGIDLPSFRYDDTLLLLRNHFNFQNNKLENMKNIIGMGDVPSHNAKTDALVTGYLYYWIYENKGKEFDFKSLKRIDNEINKFLKNGYDFAKGVRESMVIAFKDDLEDLDTNYSSSKEKELVDKMREYAHNMLPSNYVVTFPEKNAMINKVRQGIIQNDTIKYSDETIWSKIKEVGYENEKSKGGYLIPERLMVLIETFIKKAITKINIEIQEELRKEKSENMDIDLIVKQHIEKNYNVDEATLNKAVKDITGNTITSILIRGSNESNRDSILTKVVDTYLNKIGYVEEQVNEVNTTKSNRAVMLSYNMSFYINHPLKLDLKETAYGKELEDNGLLMHIQNNLKGRNTRLDSKELMFFIKTIIPNLRQEYDIDSFFKYGVKGILNTYFPDYYLDREVTSNNQSIYIERMKKVMQNEHRIEFMNKTGYSFKVGSPLVSKFKHITIAHPSKKGMFIEVTMNSIIIHYRSDRLAYRKKVAQGTSANILQLLEEYLPKTLAQLDSSNPKLIMAITKEIQDILDLRRN